MDLGGGPGPAHGDVPELSAPTISKEVGGVEGGTLAAVHRRRVAVGEAVGADLFRPESMSAAGVHADRQRPSFGIEGDDPAPLGVDELAVR